VVDHREEFELGVDTTGVLLEVVSDLDTARDGTVLHKVGLHLGGTGEAVVVRSVVLSVVNSPTFVLAGLVDWAWRPGAVLALLHGAAIEARGIMSNILFARRVRNTFSVGELIDTTGVATFAGATSFTVDDSLSVEANRRGVKILEEDVESISESRGRTLGPAGTAVDRDMLVLVP